MLALQGAARAGVPDRTISIDVAAPATARSGFETFSVGSDYPVTLLREDSLAQLRTVL